MHGILFLITSITIEGQMEEEIKQYLKEHLKVNIDVEWGDFEQYLTVKLEVDGEVISSDRVNIDRLVKDGGGW